MYPSLAFYNFRIFFAGQTFSQVGNWMQQTLLTWLVLELTGSGTMVGITIACQTVPILVFSPYAGMLVDRRSKRAVLLATQIALALVALILALFIVCNAVTVAGLFLLSFTHGFISAVDNPARQSFISEMVPPKAVRNALALNGVGANVGMTGGPAIAGFTIDAGFSSSICFINATSSIAIVVALLVMRIKELDVVPAASKSRGQIGETLRYISGKSDLFLPLTMMALIGLFTYNFQTTLPMMAKFTFHSGASLFGILSATRGLGATVGALIIAQGKSVGARIVSIWAAALGICMIFTAVAPTVQIMIGTLFTVGVCECAYYTIGSATLQLHSKPQFRARISSLWGMLFRGTTPLGGPLVGAIGTASSPRYALGAGAVAAIAAAGIGFSLSSQHSVEKLSPTDRDS